MRFPWLSAASDATCLLELLSRITSVLRISILASSTLRLGLTCLTLAVIPQQKGEFPPKRAFCFRLFYSALEVSRNSPDEEASVVSGSPLISTYQRLKCRIPRKK